MHAEALLGKAENTQGRAGKLDPEWSSDRIWSSPQTEGAQVSPEAESLEDPDTNNDDNDHVKNGTDAGSHGDIAINERQPNAHNNEHQDDVE